MFEIYSIAYGYILAYLEWIVLGTISFVVAYFVFADMASVRCKELYFQKSKEQRIGRRIGNIVYIKNKGEFYNPESKLRYVKGVVFVKRKPFIPRWFSIARGYLFALRGRYTQYTFPFQIERKLMTIEKRRVVVDAKTFVWNGEIGYFEAKQSTPETLIIDPAFMQNWILNKLRTMYKKAITGASASPVAVHTNMQRFSVPLSPDDYKEDTFYHIQNSPQEYVDEQRYSRLDDGFLREMEEELQEEVEQEKGAHRNRDSGG